MKRLTDLQVSALRALIRAVLLCLTAFGFRLSVDQIAATQIAAEAVLVAYTQLINGRE